MVLYKDLLTKNLSKGRDTATALLNRLSKAGGLPEPTYELQAGGNNKYPSFFFKVRFRIPAFLLQKKKDGACAGREGDADVIFTNVISGAGRCKNKKMAKSLAALECVHRLEYELDLKRSELEHKLEDYTVQQRLAKAQVQSVPVSEQIPGVSWRNIPMDDAFPETLPASRAGRIEFTAHLLGLADDDGGDDDDDKKQDDRWKNNVFNGNVDAIDEQDRDNALLAAQALTLSSEINLPAVNLQSIGSDNGLKRWANIKVARGPIKGMPNPDEERCYGIATDDDAIVIALSRVGQLLRNPRNHSDPRVSTLVQVLVANNSSSTSKNNNNKSKTIDGQQSSRTNTISSFGMAKLFVKLPKHQYAELKQLLGETFPFDSRRYMLAGAAQQNQNRSRSSSSNHRTLVENGGGDDEDDEEEDAHIDSPGSSRSRERRWQTFREHQRRLALPVDAVEPDIPLQAPVTIVRGGTGSGTRCYCLLLIVVVATVGALKEKRKGRSRRN
jgi:hypothetical protein